MNTIFFKISMHNLISLPSCFDFTLCWLAALFFPIHSPITWISIHIYTMYIYIFLHIPTCCYAYDDATVLPWLYALRLVLPFLVMPYIHTIALMSLFSLCLWWYCLASFSYTLVLISLLLIRHVIFVMLLSGRTNQAIAMLIQYHKITFLWWYFWYLVNIDLILFW